VEEIRRPLGRGHWYDSSANLRPPAKLFKHFGFTAGHVVEAVKAVLQRAD